MTVALRTEENTVQMIKDNKYNQSLIWTKSDSAQTHCFINHGDKFLQLQYFFLIQAINYYIVITHILITYTITQTIVFLCLKKKVSYVHQGYSWIKN